MRILLIATVLCAIADDDRTPARADDPNAVVLEFAKARLGEKVGDGECSSLAMAALRDLGIRPRFTSEGVKWGRARERVDDAQPGDILQFTNAQFVHKRKDRNRTSTQTYTFAQHTAIVSAVKKVRGKTLLTILHQNAGFAGDSDERRRKVSEWTLDLADLTTGELTAYQPSRD